jgi:hypothetical protein
VDNGQAPPGAPAGAPEGPSPVSPTPAAAAERRCTKCAAPLQPGQDWCLQCGAGAPGSLGAGGWHVGGAILAVAVALVLGAAAAGYAALSKTTPKARVVTTTVAQASTPAVTTPTATTPVTPGATATTPKAKATLPLGAVKPPKIPLTAVTPKAAEKATKTTTPAEATTTTPTTTTPSSTKPGGAGTGGETTSEESQQSAIVLDTDAATSYNPYNYPPSWFGDPSLAIDGDPSTAWTAQVNPESAPAMADGLLINLKAKQKIGVLQLITSTPGMTVQVYGANGHTVPTSITDPAWVPLSAFKVVKKKRVRFKLRDSKKSFTYIALWISKAPASAAGTAAEPGHVDINEVELFPTR